jgi:serine/threonine protein kinase
VNLIIHEEKLLALKIIPKTSIDKSKRIEHVKNEKKLLIALRKDSESREPLDFIVELYETFIDHDNINFVFEYLPGQDLHWILTNEHNLFLGKSGQKRKDWVCYYTSEILVALETLHTRDIIYRDMKPDNVMIDSTGHVKLIDFGFAKKLYKQNNFRTSTNCGTIGYTAPEVLGGISSGYSF